MKLHRIKDLLKELSKITEKIGMSDLPASVKGIYVYGSALYEKVHVHDIDLIIVYHQNQLQEKNWKIFEKTLKNIIRPMLIHKYASLKKRYREKYLENNSFNNQSKKLREIPKFYDFIVQDKEVYNQINQMSISLEWLKCLSWEIIRNFRQNLKIEDLLENILFKDNKNKRFDVVFVDEYNFSRGVIRKLLSLKINYKKVWDINNPNIIENIKKIPLSERKEYAKKELSDLLEDLCYYYDKYNLKNKGLIKEITLKGKETFDETIKRVKRARSLLKTIKGLRKSKKNTFQKNF